MKDDVQTSGWRFVKIICTLSFSSDLLPSWIRTFKQIHSTRSFTLSPISIFSPYSPLSDLLTIFYNLFPFILFFTFHTIRIYAPLRSVIQGTETRLKDMFQILSPMSYSYEFGQISEPQGHIFNLLSEEASHSFYISFVSIYFERVMRPQDPHWCYAM